MGAGRRGNHTRRRHRGNRKFLLSAYSFAVSRFPFPVPSPTENWKRQTDNNLRGRSPKEIGWPAKLPAVSSPVMPTVLRVGPYRFHFYSREGMEPPHIHVARDDLEAKFWLVPMALATNHGFPPHELADIGRLVKEHCETLLRKYHESHG
jgi:hypothetical protein